MLLPFISCLSRRLREVAVRRHLAAFLAGNGRWVASTVCAATEATKDFQDAMLANAERSIHSVAFSDGGVRRRERGFRLWLEHVVTARSED